MSVRLLGSGIGGPVAPLMAPVVLVAAGTSGAYLDMHLSLVTVVVADYDEAIDFFVSKLGFLLVEDRPVNAAGGRPKRWVVVRPPGAETGILLAEAVGERQVATIGEQFGGRVGLFVHVDDAEATYDRMAGAGVAFEEPLRDEPYGRVAVFRDVAGNRWDLLGPPR